MHILIGEIPYNRMQAFKGQNQTISPEKENQIFLD